MKRRPYEKLKPTSRMAVDVLRRYPSVSIRLLAKYLNTRHPALFRSIGYARDLLRIESGVRPGRDGYFPTRPGVISRRGKYKLMPAPMHVIREPYVLPVGRWGVMADLHIPFHEIRPIESAIEWFLDQKITGLIFQGDLQDCEALSFFGATAPRCFPVELEAMCDFLDMIREIFPTIPIVWQRGNHEDRLESYYRSHAAHLADLPTSDMASMLSLDKRKITMLNRKQKITINNFTMMHGHEMRGSYSPVSASRWALLKAKACCAVAHFHSTSVTTGSDINHKMLTAWSVGCMCDLEPDYNTYGNQWNWGAAMLFNDGGDNWEFKNPRILPNGKLYY